MVMKVAKSMQIGERMIFVLSAKYQWYYFKRYEYITDNNNFLIGFISEKSAEIISTVMVFQIMIFNIWSSFTEQNVPIAAKRLS